MIKLKKDSFEKGAFSATLCIMISKVIGILYVIPFYMIITSKGAALYSYAYNIYAIFLAISTAGIPLAISKLVSEYDALKYYDAKERTYKQALNLITFISVLAFIILMIFAPYFAKFIIGDAKGGNTLTDIVLVIRAISFAVLVIPFLSITRGFFQGNKFITISSFSQVIEQILRVVVVIGGSYIALKVLNINETGAIMIALSGATIGGIGAYIYLNLIFKKHKKEMFPTPEHGDKITNKNILKRIISYAIPFIVVSAILTIYNFVDIVIIFRTLTSVLKIPTNEVENIISIYSTWGEKFQRIVIAISTGIAISLIPNIVDSYTKKDIIGVKNTFNKALQLVIFAGLPLTVLISIFAKDVWYLFYGLSEIGPIIISLSIYVAFISALATTITSALQGLNKYKIVYVSTTVGILINIILNVPLIILMDKINVYPYYGSIISSIIGFSATCIIALIMTTKECQIDYKDTYKMLLKNMLPTLVLIILALILKYLLPYKYDNRLVSLAMNIVYFSIPIIGYLYISYKNRMLKKLFNKIRIR